MSDAPATFSAQLGTDFFGAGVAFDDADGDSRDDLLIGAPAGRPTAKGARTCCWVPSRPTARRAHSRRLLHRTRLRGGRLHGADPDLDGDGTPDLGIETAKRAIDSPRRSPSSMSSARVNAPWQTPGRARGRRLLGRQRSHRRLDDVVAPTSRATWPSPAPSGARRSTAAST
ncbi:MAG: hypothetical protein R3F59_30455 [Myxococcota bacterium]